MHIPDGYLSPSTCAVLYGAATPFWFIAMRRVRKFLTTRLVPLLSVMAALSFVIMMFNLPLPGGTTGHAVGVAISTIMLGPWASILAISIALLVQAVFFGDGGITTLGANCFNMAIVGSLTAYAVYRITAGGAALTSGRRVVAAALAGYTAINASALCAAVELGLQPVFFKDASGAPLYAPYGLRIAIPAIMLGHLTFAGLAETVLSAGVVAYFQRTNPSLLKRTAAGAGATGEEAGATQNGWTSIRGLCAALALMLVLHSAGNSSGRHRLGRVECAGFFHAASAPEDCRRIRARIAARPRAAGNGAPLLDLDRALSTVCTVVRPPAGSGLRTLRHVRFGHHHAWGLDGRPVAGA